MVERHYNIPIFIPEAACPHRCIFCNQYRITERAKQPTVQEVVTTVEQYLGTIPEAESRAKNIEIAFFGGSFTGLPNHLIEHYLQSVQPFIRAGRVRSLRCSTRPDYINTEVLDLLQYYHVEMVELGAQSFDHEVLRLSGRGHTAEDTRRAVALLQSRGIRFGLQMMTGLPSDTREKSFETATEIIRLQADNTRIYPCLVVKDTPLEQLYREGKYAPQTLEEAVERCAELVLLFEQHQVTVLRVGLHRAEGFDNGTALISGPYHPSFKAMVEQEIWKKLIDRALATFCGDQLVIFVPKGKSVAAIGYRRANWLRLLERFSSVRFVEDETLNGRALRIE